MSNAQLDPNGLDAHSPGAKLDAGKPMVSLVLGGFAGALLEVAKVGTFGAKKYTPNGWMTAPNGIERYADAKARHWLYESQGEKYDPDSRLLHAAHEAWNVLARLELLLRAERTPAPPPELEASQRRQLPGDTDEPSWPVEGVS